MFGRSLPDQRPDRPFAGFKLARAVISADGQRAGFAGLSIGGRRVYGVAAEASCVWNAGHAPPKRRCGCGFYCLDTLADAIALNCATENQAAMLLEVVASGRFIRYERGLRYSRQRVRAIRAGRCTCGRPATGLVEDGAGFVGWRCLAVRCPPCTGNRSSMTFGEFAACLDGPVSVSTSSGAGPAGARLAGTAVSGMRPHQASIAVLTAEIALMQARLDDLQTRVARHYGHGCGT